MLPGGMEDPAKVMEAVWTVFRLSLGLNQVIIIIIMQTWGMYM